MVFHNKDKNEEVIIFTCNCGCGQEFHIRKDIYKYNDENDVEQKDISYEISSHSSNWYTEQDGIWKIIFKRIKRAWSALRGKDYLYQDVCLTEQEYNELISELNKLK